MSLSTSVIIANTKKFMYAKKRANARSPSMYAIEYTWIRNPTPVMISDQISDRRSSCSPKLQPGSHVTSAACAPPGAVASFQRNSVPANATPISAEPTGPAHDRSCGPSAHSSTPPISGSSQIMRSMG